MLALDLKLTHACGSYTIKLLGQLQQSNITLSAHSPQNLSGCCLNCIILGRIDVQQRRKPTVKVRVFRAQAGDGSHRDR
jgi:hypothetical protein